MKRIFVLFAVFAVCVMVEGFDWPMKQNRIIMNFCQSTGNDFRTGIVISGDDEPVHPIASGDLVFSYEEGEYTSIPFGLGSFAAVLHEGGIESVYSHLKKGTVKREAMNIASRDVIGITGNTGSSLGNNVFLQIFNIEDDEILNPVRNLKPLMKDSRAPVIKDVFIKRNGEMLSAETVKLIKAGKYEMYVSAYDPQEDTRRRVELAPYRILVSNNGNEIASISLQSVKEKGGRLVLFKTEKPFGGVYAAQNLILLGALELIVGKNYIQVIASDFVGNQAVKDIILDAIR